MKHLILACVLAACGGSAPEPAQPAQSENPDLAVASPSPSAPSSSSSSVPCAQEIALDCPGGVDGCTTGATTVHACVSSAAKAGPSCSQEIALVCPSGEIDACLVSPPAAQHHICIRRS